VVPFPEDSRIPAVPHLPQAGRGPGLGLHGPCPLGPLGWLLASSEELVPFFPPPLLCHPLPSTARALEVRA